MTDPRADLAARQAQLLRALLADGDAPPGFAADALRREADALRAKRRRVTAMLRPDVVDELGDGYRAAFDRYARTHPKSVHTRARADADAFTDWAVRTGLCARPRSAAAPSRWRRWWRR